jgi:hypothetical protein
VNFEYDLCYLTGRSATAGQVNKETKEMTKIASSILALSLAFSSAVSAGGPIVVVEEGQPEVVAETPRSGWIVPVLIGGIILCAIACGSDDDEPTEAVSD